MLGFARKTREMNALLTSMRLVAQQFAADRDAAGKLLTDFDSSAWDRMHMYGRGSAVSNAGDLADIAEKLERSTNYDDDRTPSRQAVLARIDTMILELLTPADEPDPDPQGGMYGLDS